MTYAVLWSENGGPEFAGRLSLEPRGVALSGTAASCDVAFADLTDVYLERSVPQRHTRRPLLVLVTRAGGQVEIGSLQGLGALHELTDEVMSRRLDGGSNVTAVRGSARLRTEAPARPAPEQDGPV
jgi:hypothetical protein